MREPRRGMEPADGRANRDRAAASRRDGRGTGALFNRARAPGALGFGRPRPADGGPRSRIGPQRRRHGWRGRGTGGRHRVGVPAPRGHRRCPRSEEHTSELQSRSDLVCRLLLEKKKKKQNHITNKKKKKNNKNYKYQQKR